MSDYNWDKKIKSELKRQKTILSIGRKKKEYILPRDKRQFESFCVSHRYHNPLIDIPHRLGIRSPEWIPKSLFNSGTKWCSTKTYIYDPGNNEVLQNNSQLLHWYSDMDLYWFMYSWKYQTYCEQIVSDHERLLRVFNSLYD